MKKTSFFSFFPPYLDCEVIFAILSYVKNGNCIIMVLKNPLPNVKELLLLKTCVHLYSAKQTSVK